MHNLNQKGQAFAVYRLLIGAILAIMIMYFISGIYLYFEEQKAIVSERGLQSAIRNAVSSPNGDVIAAENLTFRPGTVYSKGAFAHIAAIPESCIELSQTRSVSAVEASEDEISIRKQIMLDVYVKCSLELCADDENPSDDVKCEISFGEKLESG
ncbi:MAG: hypothetical protein HYW05_04890 [Candidatus Diapherotrites archaeon]|nr:hypothetical protein [Candidatus Diapherotrites archaeon]